MNFKRQAFQGVIWSGLQNWGIQAGSLLIFFILARIISPESFGLIALANTFIAFLNIFINLGFSTALIQRDIVESKHLDTAFWMQICLGVFFFTLAFLSAPLLAWLFEQPMITPVFRTLSTTFLFRSLVIVQRALLVKNLAFKKIAVRALLGIVISGFIGIVLAIKNLGVWSLVGQQISFEIIGVLTFWGLSSWRPHLQFSLQHLRDLSSFSLSISGSNILKFLNENTDNLVIGYFLGGVALGYYSVGYRVLKMMTQLLVNTLNQVLLPLFSKLQNEPDRLVLYFYKAIQLSSFFAFPCCVGLIILGKEIVEITFGNKWQPSTPIMQVLTFGVIAYLVLFFSKSILVAMGRPFEQLRLDILNVCFNTLACLIAVKSGILAVAVAYVVSDFLIIPISLRLLNKQLGLTLKAFFGQLLMPLICTLILAVFLLTTKIQAGSILSPQAVLALCVSLGVCIYLLSFRLFFPNLFDKTISFIRGNLSSQSL